MSSLRTYRSTRSQLRLTNLEARLAPATFNVTNDANTGVGSLRQAVLDANAAGGADSIAFSSYFNVPRSITLASEISITGAVTIDGPSAASVTISGNNLVRIFNTQAASAGTAISLLDLTLKSASAPVGGGAISVGDEALSVTRCVFSGNYSAASGGAISAANGSSLTATDCTFASNSAGSSGGAISCGTGKLTATNCAFTSNSSGNGGAVAVFGGTLTATDCAFTSNGAYSGGAIYVSDTGASAALTRCDISGNSAQFAGGMSISGTLLLEAATVSGNTAVGSWGYYGYYASSAGGIACSGNATIRNSTISSNAAGYAGGISAGSSTLVIQNSTITRNAATYYNGGGILANTVSLESCIVAYNSGYNGPDIYASTVNAKSSSVFGRFGITTFNDQGGNRPADENPQLGPLQDNGGPTKTHLLLPGSPCIDTGSNPASLTTDQRGAGFPRVVDGFANMGAVEGVDVTPTATLVSMPPTIITPGGTSYSVVIRYDDSNGIDLASIDLADINVSGPGYAVAQAPTAYSIAGSGKSVTITYTLPAPGGAFDISDNGLYSVALTANQVRDTDSPTQHYAATTTFGQFRVAIPFALVVDEPSDIDDGNTTKGHVSLREALRLTNAVVGSPDTISFDPAVFNATMTLKLANGQMNITDPLTLIGPGAGLLTLDAQGLSTVFSINPGTEKAVSVAGLTLTNGTYSGITATGELTLSGVVISKCSNYWSGGGVSVSGSLTATNCSIIGNSTYNTGGGIYVSGNLLLEACTVSGNLTVGYWGYWGYYYPGAGGGVVAGGSATIRNCTISSNFAGYGGGINSGTLVVQNSTITGNTGGGIYSSPITLESSIVAKNLGGEIFASGAVSAKNSLIFDQSGITTFNDLGGNRPAGEDPRLGPLQNNGGPGMTHALLPGSPCFNTGSNPASLTTDQRGTGFSRMLEGAVDMGAFEGVDVNPTATLQSGPAAITVPGGTDYSIVIRYDDHVGIDLTTIDLNDITVTGPDLANPQSPTGRSIVGSGKVVTVTYTLPAPGGSFDITDNGHYTIAIAVKRVGDLDAPPQHFVAASPLGSFSVRIGGAVTVDEANDIDDGNTTKGHLSLREALRLTNFATGTTDSITFDMSVFSAPTTLKLTAGEFTITDPLVLVGPGPGRLTLDAVNKSRIFNINTVSPVSLSGMTLINGKAGGGGGIFDAGGLTLSKVVISNCQSEGNGGGVLATGSLTISDSTINNNSIVSFGSGGGVYLTNGTVTIERCSIFANTAITRGGGLHIYSYSTTRVVDSTISGNSAADGAGGAYIYCASPTASYIRNSTISGNSASWGGGLVVRYSGTFPIANTTITANNVANQGGGIAVLAGSISLNSTIVAGNSATIGMDMYFNSATSVPGDNNIVGVKNSGNFTLTGTGNKTGTVSSPLNALLGALVYNGGPTKTHALLSKSPALDQGNNAASLTNDQRGYLRVFNGKADIGAFEVQTVPPPRVANNSITINGGAIQRSRVTTLTIDFDQLVTLPANPAAAFQLKRQSDNAIVGLTASVTNDSATRVTLTFTGAVSEFGSLADGIYTLTAFASQLSNLNGSLDGNANGVGGDDFVFIGSPANGLCRLFGDADGNYIVDQIDYIAFRNAFNNGSSAAFDFDDNGQVRQMDFIQFRNRFNL